jgi:osmotically-inducible protein OsmY
VEPIQVSFVDGTAVLRGVVATPHDRELAEQWMLLEPGVRAVRNELTVAGKASSEASRSEATQSP